MQLYTKILLGLIAGVVVGVAANASGNETFQQFLVSAGLFGTAWIRLIMMIVIPLVVASLLVGTASLGDLRKVGRIGGKTLAYYFCTTAVAVVIGLGLSQIVRPGSGVEESTRTALAEQFGEQAAGRMEIAAEAPSMSQTLLNMIPRSPVQAAADFQLLPLIVFTVIFGAAISTLDHEYRDPILKVFEGINQASMVVIDWIMILAPYAVFILIAAVVAQFGWELLKSLLVYTLVVAAGLLIHATVSFGLILQFLARLNPFEFFRRIRAVPVIAFSTSSSNATLPFTIETAEEEIGVPKEVASFVLPLGATMNMDGTALYQAVAVMFIAQIYGIPMDLGAQLTVVLTATLASIGAAGVPSAGIITLVVVLESVGLGAQLRPGSR